MIVRCHVIRPKVPPEDVPLFQQLVKRAMEGDGCITEAEYQQLEHAFILAQGVPGQPVVFWGWGHQRLLRETLRRFGVWVRRQ
jgi:hypothetical protein